ncbi:TIGR02450 family Trp-rich protein [Polynucleobacter sp. JS-Mosq-20-D10]|uniref:TIGR02450 family Trp-rich protein n=1 Tax=Polynucleobacter sp. JS-Mosq-20-D10 TaxID=2576922 RepID=UPI001BFCFA70|nr:TIGR02450 family Trp-rich protein [Polynucleobacter sp. JS-Mosq-20-D10]QWD99693.1 TIGR02450 family Trp-rich protein [Polynucleobacter sp. JS-Mosq-20-D10]
MNSKEKNLLSPKKLLLTKWTAVKPSHKRKHFLVSKVILPELPEQAIEFVELEAVFDQHVRVIPWRELKDSEIWLQGWV